MLDMKIKYGDNNEKITNSFWCIYIGCLFCN